MSNATGTIAAPSRPVLRIVPPHRPFAAELHPEWCPPTSAGCGVCCSEFAFVTASVGFAGGYVPQVAVAAAMPSSTGVAGVTVDVGGVENETAVSLTLTETRALIDALGAFGHERTITASLDGENTTDSVSVASYRDVVRLSASFFAQGISETRTAAVEMWPDEALRLVAALRSALALAEAPTIRDVHRAAA